MVEKPVNSKCGLRVECVGNKHDTTTYYTSSTEISFVEATARQRMRIPFLIKLAQ